MKTRINHLFWLSCCAASVLIKQSPTLAAPSPDPLTGHYYEEVASLLTWDMARTNAAAQLFGGAAGHLATIKNARENLIVQHLAGTAERWIGLTDSTTTSLLDGFNLAALGTTEAGNTSGLPLPAEGVTPGSGQRGFGFRWITGELYDWLNWRAGTPGGSGLGSDGVYTVVQGAWQDAPAGASLGEPYGPTTKHSTIEYELALNQERFHLTERQAGDFFNGVGTVPGLAAADALLALTEGHTNILAQATNRAYVISFHDPDYGSGVADLVRSPFLLNVPGVNENHFAVRASAQVVIPQAGPWTFAVASANTFRLRVGGNEFVGDGIIPNTPPRLARLGQGTLTAAPGGDGETFYFPQAGVYDLYLTTFDSGSFAYVQLLASAGTRASWDAALFKLVGDELNGGLALACQPRAAETLALALQALPGGVFRVSWNSHPCARYRLEFSENLLSWQPLVDGLHPAAPVTQVDHASGGQAGFYRLIELK